MKLDAVQAVNGTEADLRRLVGDFAASTPSGNKTTMALVKGCGGTR